MIEFIFIKELAKVLNYMDSRSALKWCKYNNVGVMTDSVNKKKYVIKAEFEAARMNEALKYLKNKYGESNYIEVLNSQMNFYAEYRTVVEEKVKKQQKNNNGNRTDQRGFNEMRFLNDLRKI